MSSIKWDPRSKGFMLTSDTYKNKLLYIQGDPFVYDTRAPHRMCLWFWDYTTSTRTHLPPLYYQIYRAAIKNHILYVLVKGKRTFSFYYLDLKLDKNQEWKKLSSFTRSYTDDWDLDLIPLLQDSKKDDLIIVFEEEIVLLNHQTHTKQTLPYDFISYDDEILKVVHVRHKLYIFRDMRLIVYSIEDKKTDEEIPFQPFLGYTPQRKNCHGACVHVYDQRFILIVCENKIHKNEDEIIEYWFVAVFDCKSQVWLHNRRHRYRINDFEDTVYSKRIRNYLWHENFLCFMHCERSQDDDNIQLDHHISDAITIQYHISFFLPNWYVIRFYLKMRFLFDNNRATVKQAYKDTSVGMLYDLLVEKGLFPEVLEYLVCPDKSRYCSSFN